MTPPVGEAPARSIAEKIEFVRNRLLDCGLPIKPSSRLDREASFFRDDRGMLRTVSPGDPVFRLALEGLRDFTLFEYILEHWPFEQGNEEARRRLKMALGDDVDPRAESRRTPGRDTELELFVAVALRRAGLLVEFPRPQDSVRVPDIRTRIDLVGFCVEAKRPKSRDRILDAVRDAADQIEQSGCPGAIYLDTTLAFDGIESIVSPKFGSLIKVFTETEFRRLHNAALEREISFMAQALRAPFTMSVG